MTNGNQDIVERKVDDDVSIDNSVSTEVLSVDDAKQENTPSGQFISEDDFYEGVTRTKSHWRVLASGQVLSLLLATSGAMSSSLYYQCNISVPTMQTAIVFMFMSFHLINLFTKNKSLQQKRDDTEQVGRKRLFRFSWRKQKDSKTFHNITPGNLALGQSVSLDSQEVRNDNSSPSPSHTLFGLVQLSLPMWVYGLVAFFFVEATFFASLSLRYTSYFSAAILDNINIFAAMIASRLMLKRRYSWRHILGAFICCFGVGLNLLSDNSGDMDTKNVVDDDFAKLEAIQFPHRIIGDCIAIAGGILFGLCDVIIEGIVKSYGSGDEYLGCVGLCGFFIAVIQVLVIERGAVSKLLSKDEISMDAYRDYENPLEAPRTCGTNIALLLVLGYAWSFYLFVRGMNYFLSVSESALLMISILTSDLWAVVFTVFVQHISPSPLLFAAFGFMLTGVLIYEMSPSPLGAAEDMVQVNKEIEMAEDHNDPFQLSNISYSWDSQNSNDSKTKELV